MLRFEHLAIYHSLSMIILYHGIGIIYIFPLRRVRLEEEERCKWYICRGRVLS